MRLYNIYYLCKKLIDVFEKERILLDDDSLKTYNIVDLDEYWVAIDSLKSIPLFKSITNKIHDAITFSTRDKLIVDSDIRTKFESYNNTLKNQMSSIIELYESLNIPETHTGIDVKIPKCEDLKEYIKYLNEIDFIFTQCPYLLHKDETIKFETIDVGSQWLNFIIELSAGSAAVFYILNNLALVLDKVQELRSHYYSIKQQKEALKVAQNKAELSDGEKEIFNMLKTHYMSEVVSSLEEKISPLEDGDQRGRLEKSLDKLCVLLDKGVEIYASLDVPKDIQVLFPALDEQEKLSETVLQYIEDKSKTDSDK